MHGHIHRLFARTGAILTAWLLIWTNLAPANEPAAPYRADPPRQVLLGIGPFQAAMAANVKYLLANSDPDDMLLRFRQLAGKPNPPGHWIGWEHSYPAHAAQFLMGAGNTLYGASNPDSASGSTA